MQEQLQNVVQVQANAAAFAAIMADGSVAAWGQNGSGGECSAVQDQLFNVQHIQATKQRGAFAAIRADGRVVTWGSEHAGGDSSGVQDQLRDVRAIQSPRAAFAAIRSDGRVVTWGDKKWGGDSSAVQRSSLPTILLPLGSVKYRYCSRLVSGLSAL